MKGESEHDRKNDGKQSEEAESTGKPDRRTSGAGGRYQVGAEADLEEKGVDELKTNELHHPLERDHQQPPGREGTESGAAGDLQPVLQDQRKPPFHRRIDWAVIG